MEFLLLGEIILFAALLFLGFFLWNFYRKFRALFPAEMPENERAAFVEMLERIARLEVSRGEIEKVLRNLDAASQTSFQKVGFRRFNPFRDTGGDQSFALCLLDRDNNGIVISSLYGREGTRVYAKAIEAGEAKHPMSGEEEEVLRKALEESGSKNQESRPKNKIKI